MEFLFDCEKYFREHRANAQVNHRVPFFAWHQLQNSKKYFFCSNGQIEAYCRQLTSELPGVRSPELHTLAAIFRRALGVGDCIEFDYEDEIQQLQADDTEVALYFRPWFYQTCSEFGWYQTTDSENQPFGTKSPIEFDLEMCVQVFGNVFEDLASEKYMQHTNMVHGGFHPAVSNVYFTHGSLDPWHPMGVLSDLNEDSPSVVIKGLSSLSF